MFTIQFFKLFYVFNVFLMLGENGTVPSRNLVCFQQSRAVWVVLDDLQVPGTCELTNGCLGDGLPAPPPTHWGAAGTLPSYPSSHHSHAIQPTYVAHTFLHSSFSSSPPFLMLCKDWDNYLWRLGSTPSLKTWTFCPLQDREGAEEALAFKCLPCARHCNMCYFVFLLNPHNNLFYNWGDWDSQKLKELALSLKTSKWQNPDFHPRSRSCSFQNACCLLTYPFVILPHHQKCLLTCFPCHRESLGFLCLGDSIGSKKIKLGVVVYSY